MGIKAKLKQNEMIYDSYKKLKYKNRLTKSFVFEKRTNNKKNLLIIIAGYKEFTWGNVFDRVEHFILDNMDVCIASSGIYSDELSKIAEKNNWSYLSTKRNNVSLLQNTVINEFTNAEMIYKMDEDIFVTENTFESMMDTYSTVKESIDIPYIPGFVAPLIPINGYGHVRILEHFGLSNYYKEHFGDVRHAAGSDRPVENNVNVAKFFWGETGDVPTIDDMAMKLSKNTFDYSVCPIRFSIGCILFHRNFWKSMNMFSVGRGNGMGGDEVEINSECVFTSQPMIIDENTVAGHLSFGPQNKAMKEYYLDHLEKFSVPQFSSQVQR